MFEKSISATTLILSGIIYIVLGICLFFIQDVTLKVLLFAFGVVTISTGIYEIFKIFFKISKNEKLLSLLNGLGDAIIGILILSFPNVILHSLAICFGIYLLFHTIIDGIQYFIYRKNKIKGRLKIILNIVFQLFFFIPLLFHLNQNIQVISMILGIYFIIYGITKITDFLTIFIPKRTTDYIKQQIQIPLPVIFNAFIPRRLITLINEMLEVNQDSSDFNSKKYSITPDIYVLIHLAKSGTASMGHVEIAFHDHVYSYGNYDMHSRNFFDMIGDGVVVVADKKKYINYMVEKKERYIIEFGLSLTSKEKKIVTKQLDDLINQNTTFYYPDYALYEKKLLPEGNYQDMSSEIYKYADGTFYKIIKGKYKKFFVLKTNCAMVAQFVLSSIGKQILCINGIITPGAYYDYLNARFKLKNTNVISRKVYTKENKQKSH